MKHLLFVILVSVGVCLSADPLAGASTEPIVMEATINAPIDEVWKIWTTKEGMESWMVTKTEIDLRVGGTWRTSYSKDSNLEDDTSIHHTILAYDPGRMFSFRTVKTPKNFPFASAISKTWTVVYFEPLGARTKVTIRMLGYSEDDESQRMRAFFEKGNKATLENLLKKFP